MDTVIDISFIISISEFSIVILRKTITNLVKIDYVTDVF